jgi:hypothetical protein
MRGFRPMLVVVVVAFLALFVGAGAAGTKRVSQSVVCSGGSIAPGFYDSITVTGFCTVPGGVVFVRGDLTIAPSAGLDAITAGTLIVHGNLNVGVGGFLGLGCSAGVGCPFTTHDRVDGTLNASQPAALIVHAAILGSVSSVGGSAGINCDNDPSIGGPDYLDFSNNSIYGDITVSGYTGCWFGFIHNTIRNGNVTLNNNTLADPDAMEVVTNIIFGNLACSGNSPAPHLGDSGGRPNVVFGVRSGQCAHL